MPAPYLIDTDHCIAYLTAANPHHANVAARIAAAQPADLHVSVVTAMELAEGPYHSPTVNQRQANQAAIAALIAGVTVLGVSNQVAQEFGRIRADLRRAGQMIGDLDIAIAATALVHQLTLVTNNTGHFNRIPGLPLENWY